MNTCTFKKLGAGITLSLLTSTLLHATNGDHLLPWVQKQEVWVELVSLSLTEQKVH